MESTPSPSAPNPPGLRRRLLVVNARANVIRGLSSALLNLVLPLVLLRLFSIGAFSVWVLVFGVSSYALYLDLGLTVTVSTVVAQAEAGGNRRLAAAYVAGSLRLLTGVAGALLLVYGALSLKLPALFPRVPEALRGEGSWALLLLGIAQVAVLYSNVFIGYFNALQRAQVPAAVVSVGKLVAFAATVSAAATGANLAVTASAYLVATAAYTAALGVAYVRQSGAPLLRVSENGAVRTLISLTSVIGLLSLCMLVVSGLDTAVVGRLAYRDLAPFGVATVLSTVVIGTFGAAMAPLLPEFSRMVQHGRNERLVDVLAETSRLTTTFFVLSVVALLFLGAPILEVVAGRSVGHRAFPLFLLLVVAAASRASITPLSMAVIALNRRRALLLISGVSEAVVNLATSIVLCRHIGAAGVAIGTILGASTSVAVMIWIVLPAFKELLSKRRDVVTSTWVRPLLTGAPATAGGLVVYLGVKPTWLEVASATVGAAATLWLCRDDLRQIVRLRSVGRELHA